LLRIDALPVEAGRIRTEFGSAAINPYPVFTGNGPEKTLVSAFGFPQTTIS
jgi:hypothetical protein